MYICQHKIPFKQNKEKINQSADCARAKQLKQRNSCRVYLIVKQS